MGDILASTEFHIPGHNSPAGVFAWDELPQSDHRAKVFLLFPLMFYLQQHPVLLPSNTAEEKEWLHPALTATAKILRWKNSKR